MTNCTRWMVSSRLRSNKWVVSFRSWANSSGLLTCLVLRNLERVILLVFRLWNLFLIISVNSVRMVILPCRACDAQERDSPSKASIITLSVISSVSIADSATKKQSIIQIITSFASSPPKRGMVAKPTTPCRI